MITQPQAIVGLLILGFFVLVALFGPALLSQDPKTKTGPVYAPSQRRTGWAPTTAASTCSRC